MRLYKALPDKTKWWTRSAAAHLNTRWTTSWTPAKTAREERSTKETKARKNNRSLEKRPYPILPGSNFQGSADQESYVRNKNFSQLPVKACEEWLQWYAVVLWNVTKSLPFGFSLLFCSWFVPAVLPCGYFTSPIYGNTKLRYEQQTLKTLFCTLKSDFMDVKRFEF